MKAVLLAGGYGTRLRPLTDHTPKCLVPIRGVPLLELWLKRLTQAGVSEFLVNTHYLAPQVNAFIAASPYAPRVQLVHEEELLGTAGTLRANRAFWEQENALMVVHADNLCECDLAAFMQAHANRPAHCLMTMMTFDTDQPRSCGIVELDAEGVVVRFHEKQENPPGRLANGAVYIFSRELLESLTTEDDLSTQVLPHLMGRIYTWKNTQLLQDIGTPEAYAKYA
jgi:mannose-1-phosphate guanylyltransferase